MSDDNTYWAHSANDKGEWQTQEDHTREVTRGAEENAKGLGFVEEARLAGLLHDLGKYSSKFQDRLHGQGKGLDHWSAGAWVAIRDYRSKAAALAIQGHHVGLQRGGGREDFKSMDPNLISMPGTHPMGLTLTETKTELLFSRLRADGFDPQIPAHTLYNKLTACSSMLDVRMLFSTLVDADYLDTEAHFSSPRQPGIELDAEAAYSLLENKVAQIAGDSKASEEIKRVRADLWDACIKAGRQPCGLWTLTAPTGAGKTLSMLGFALQQLIYNTLPHARRIIMVVPFLSIIDQTAAIYRDLFSAPFGNGFMIEHHSLAGTRAEPEREGETDVDDEPTGYGLARQRERQLTENWDCPLVITTNVQFLESLFSNRPSTARKLHRLANSVILMDEVQTLPQNIVLPTLAALSHLSIRYGASIVFSTATQPAFQELDSKVRPLCTSGWQTREIVPADLGLFDRSRRVLVEWPSRGEKLSWQTVADTLGSEKQSVCIVNLKRHALDLAKRLDGVDGLEVRHLSTSMCPKHRRQVLKLAKTRLVKGSHFKFCLISTQCIEAGVDGIDSPVLFRAFGPFEAIAQAAGRCNRSGSYEIGRVVVFHPEDSRGLYPGSEYERAAQVTASLLEKIGADAMDIYSPEVFEQYYKLLYKLTDFDAVNSKLVVAINAQDYVEVAKLYRLIDNDSMNVLVPYRDENYGLDPYNSLVDEARASGLTAKWIAKARPYTVSLFRPRLASDPLYYNLEAINVADRPSADWFVYGNVDDYSPTFGLVPATKSGFWNA